MVKNHQIQTNQTQQTNDAQNAHQPSRLEKFALEFEYNKTLQEIRRDTRRRTHKHA